MHLQEAEALGLDTEPLTGGFCKQLAIAKFDVGLLHCIPTLTINADRAKPLSLRLADSGMIRVTSFAARAQKTVRQGGEPSGRGGSIPAW